LAEFIFSASHHHDEEMSAVKTSIILISIILASFATMSTSADVSMPFMALYEDSTATNWTITIGHVSNSNPIPLTDICVMMKENNSIIGLMPTAVSNLPSNLFLNGVSYHDASDPMHLNEWDYFVLNRTTYGIGSSITFTTPDGTSTYATATIGMGHSAPPHYSTDFLLIIALASAVAISGAAIALHFKKRRKAGDR
jgi:hypothetical protein